MTLLHVAVLTAFALLVGQALPARVRLWFLLGGSVAALYWLQPALPIRNLDFWLPTTAVVLTVLVWAITQGRAGLLAEDRGRRSAAGALVIFGVIVAIGLTRYFEPLCCLTPSRPPEALRLALALALGSVVAVLPAQAQTRSRFLPAAAILLLIALFLILKSEPLAQAASAWLRRINGQPAELASHLDLAWLGFSYLAFRLLHTLRDYQTGRLPALSLGEFATYALFFPAYTAGPIDRAQHFAGELRLATGAAPATTEAAAQAAVRAENLNAGAWRILLGVFKKFVLADSLALISLNAQNAAQVQSGLWLWVLLYAYAWRLYFDFSGYTDLAIGLARLCGLRLPENFERPYLKTNLTAFWNSWHITLAAWFRAYFFNPVTRYLRSRSSRGGQPLPVWTIILAGQLGTMALIGLWHGITWNFIIWGIWHGLGLFIHNRWSDFIRPRLPDLAGRPHLQRGLALGGWLLTYHYVVLGWVWFVLPNPSLALETLAKLYGLN